MQFIDTVNPSEELYLEALDVVNWHMSDKSSEKGSNMTIEQAEIIVHNYKKAC